MPDIEAMLAHRDGPAKPCGFVWGRDELRVGEMWNSNSVIAWLLCGAGIGLDEISPPDRGTAPGWDAGIEAWRVGGIGLGQARSPRAA